MRRIDADKVNVVEYAGLVHIPPDDYLGLCAFFKKQLIDEQPTINPDDLRERGRWIQISKARYYEESDRYICSICGSIDENGEQDFEVTTPPYCEYCGAKMDGKENEDA